MVALWQWRAATPLEDDSGRCRQLDRAVRAWAAREGFPPREGSERRQSRDEGGRRWIAVERAYWFPPARSPGTVSRRLRRLAAALGLDCRETGRGRDTLVVAFAFPDGREVFALRFARQAFAAICLDDLGYRWEAAKRVVALPCKLTCAVIPLTPHARAVASLAAAGGKEVFLHMPMASRGRMPEVPEYGMMVRGGQTDPQVRANLARAFANLPNAVGMNNHEGSLATEDPSSWPR